MPLVVLGLLLAPTANAAQPYKEVDFVDNKAYPHPVGLTVNDLEQGANYQCKLLTENDGLSWTEKENIEDEDGDLLGNALDCNNEWYTLWGLATAPFSNCEWWLPKDGKQYAVLDASDQDGFENFLRPTLSEGHINSHMLCSAAAWKQLQKDGELPEDAQFTTHMIVADSDDGFWAYVISFVVISLSWLLAWLASWLVDWGGFLVSQLMTAHQFITHPFVQTGWPVVQGIVNIGFIVSLLFIAAATVLRIENFGARRLLPRLIIAALLVNFSLVIGGVIIDLSRLSTSIFGIVMLGENEALDPVIETKGFGWQLLNQMNFTTHKGISDAVKASKQGGPPVPDIYNFRNDTGVFDIGPNPNEFELSLTNNAVYGNLNVMFRVVMGMFMIVAIGVALMIFAFGLFMRYVMLLLLLIVSPIAYLAIAMPAGQQIATKWWNSFLKYVIYAPVVVFVLFLIIKVLGSPSDPKTATEAARAAFNADYESVNQKSLIFDSAVSVGFLVLTSLAAISAGKHLGIAGAGFAINFAANRGRQLRGYGQTALKKAGYGAYVGSGLRYGKRTIGDATKTALGNYGSRIRGIPYLGKAMPAKRDAKGKLLPGQQSFGSNLGGKISPHPSAAARNAARAGDNANHPALNLENLTQGAVRNTLKQSQLRAITQEAIAHPNPDNEGRMRILMSDLNVVAKMDNATKALLMGNATFSKGFSSALSKLDDRINRSNQS